jgi:hypothetical protein
MQQIKTSFLQTLFAARRQTQPAQQLKTLDRAQLGRVAGGGNESNPETPRGGW